MTAGCCGAPGLDVSGCVQRGLATRRSPPLAIAGPAVAAPSGLWAVFSADIDGDRLRALRFDAAACATLVAYCQALVETLPGRRLHDCSVDAAALTALLAGVPPTKRDRAAVAAAALRAALDRAGAGATATDLQAREGTT